MGPKHIGVTTLTFQGHVTSSITWRFDSPYKVSYWCFIGTKHFPDIWLQIYRGHDLDPLGHVTLLVMWPFDAPHSIFYRRSIVTDSLSPAVIEILGPKHIGVTTFIFEGHVTSSITWRFDSAYRVSYWWWSTISKCFRDIWLQIYRGHDLDLLGSRDVIGHVTHCHVTIWWPI